MENFLNKVAQFKERIFVPLVKRFPDWISPNLLTVIRALLVIPIIYLLWQASYWLAVLLIVPAFILDWLDGVLARTKKQISLFGKLADPVADKLLFLPVLLIIGPEIIPGYLVYLILGLEISLVGLVFLLRILQKPLGVRFIPGSNIYGKFKFTFQVIGIFFLFLSLQFSSLAIISQVIFWLAAGLALLSIIKHCLTFEKVVQ